MEVSFTFYRVYGVLWRSTTAAVTAGRGHTIAVSRSRASSWAETKTTTPLCSYPREGVRAGVGLLFGAGPWAAWWAAAWLSGQVTQVRFFSSFLFLFYICTFKFIFEFC
jgi:hypothetical protein